MGSFTVNNIFDLLKEGRILRNPEKGGFRFDRRERVQKVFPERLCEEIASRSLSYYSWFLNMDRQGAPVRDCLRSLFEEDALEVVREMTEKCGQLLADCGSESAQEAGAWDGLRETAGRELPLFVRGSEAAGRLEQTFAAAPPRALAWLFLAAGMDGFSMEQYERLLACWRMMNRSMLSGGTAEPASRLQAGELLYLDGNRTEALQQLELAADRLREQLRESGTPDPGENGFLGKILLRLGEMYLCGDEDGTGAGKALDCLRESVSCGCDSACGTLALLELRKGEVQAAKQTLRRGADAGDAVCLRMLGNSFYRGDELADHQKDLHRAAGCYLRGAGLKAGGGGAGDPVCQYMLGRILEETADGARPGQADPVAVEGHGASGEAAGGSDPERALSPEGNRILEELSGQRGDPAYWYAAAARQGNAEAAVRLNRLRWHSADREKDRLEDSRIRRGRGRKRICLLNSLSEKNLLFAGSLPGDSWIIIACTGSPGEESDGERERRKQFFRELTAPETDRRTQEDLYMEGSSRVRLCSGTIAQTLRLIGSQVLEDARTAVPGAGSVFHAGRQNGSQQSGRLSAGGTGLEEPVQRLLKSFPEILCVAFDGEERKNVQDGLQLLRTAFLLHEESGIYPDPDERLFYLLSERVKAYILAEETFAAPVFDSAFSRLGGFYLPLYLCDRAKMASAWLLDRLPLFIPCLQQGKERGENSRRMDVLIAGDHPGILQLCKDMIAAAQIGDGEEFPFSLTVVGEEADLLEERFLADCPGIADPPDGVLAAAPQFVKMTPETRSFQELLRVRPGKARPEEEERLSRRIQSASYLVVYTKDEKRNLTLAMYLREWYLKTDPTFTRHPVIAAYCENSAFEEQMGTLTAGAEEAGFGWFNNYQIEAFGTEEELFSWRALEHSRLEQCAMASHFSYYTFTTQADRFRAEHDYFSRNYNRDASRMNALSLPYRLFSAGITFADWHDYTADVSRETLADRFEEWLEAGDLPDIELMARYEHGRWNRTMLSRGWMPASADQMLAYIQRGSSRHQLYIAKLHPFLCSWERLGENGTPSTGLQREYSQIMRQVRPDREPADIRGIDRENVRRTAEILRCAHPADTRD